MQATLLLVGTLVNKDHPKLGPMVGLGYIEQYLLSYGIGCKTYDLRIGSTKGLLKKIKSESPAYVGFYLATMNYANNLPIIKQVKDEFPNIKIIVGGPHVSTVREKLLKDYEYIDYGCVLEGEELVKELLQKTNVATIKGLIYRDQQGNIIFNGERPFQSDLTKFPFPKYESLKLGNYSSRIISITTSRGCPYSCTYCPVSTTIGKKFRMRSPEDILDELKYWVNKGHSEFYFIDDNFTFNKDRADEICNKIITEGLHNKISLSLPNGIRADRVDYETLKLMRNAGFVTIAFGVESANNHVLKRMKKGESIEDIDKAVRQAIELGLNVRLFFIIGHPGESYSDFENSIKFANKYPVRSAVFYNLIPFPKTELHAWVSDNNWYIDKKDVNHVSLMTYDHWSEIPIFETPEMSRDERIRAYRLGLETTNKIQYNWFKLAFENKYPFIPGLHWIIYNLFKNVYIQKIYQRNKWLRRGIETFKSNVFSKPWRGRA